MKYLKPKNIRDVGLLTWEQEEGKDDDQWLYLPASRQVKRITGGSKKEPFMGSDLAYEDFRPENLDAHEYKLLKEENIDGQDCWVVEAIPSTAKEKKDSGYSKRIFWIRKDIYFSVKTEFYNRRNHLAKNGYYKELENIRGEIWRMNLTIMEKPQIKHGLNTDFLILDFNCSDGCLQITELKKLFHNIAGIVKESRVLKPHNNLCSIRV